MDYILGGPNVTSVLSTTRDVYVRFYRDGSVAGGALTIAFNAEWRIQNAGDSCMFFSKRSNLEPLAPDAAIYGWDDPGYNSVCGNIHIVAGDGTGAGGH